MTFEKMTLNQRIQAANIDCMRHPQYALLSGVICMGKSEVSKNIPTAATNGRDKKYGEAFIQPLNRKQLRYLVLHENFHVALKHCILYRRETKAMPRLANIAQDYVVNALIEELDPDFTFVERPTQTLLIDRKYFGWSFPQVLNDLLKQGRKEPDKDGEGNGGDDFDEPLDVHEDPVFDDAEDEQQHSKNVDDANRQGEMLARKLAGKGGGGRDIFGHAKERTTNYVEAMQDWLVSVCSGDENSRFCPPNKRMLASGYIMPSHFNETVGELILAPDTSGSMSPYYRLIFGEIARMLSQVRPEAVRILWWDNEVCGDQVFKPVDYEQIATLLKPQGGGGTTPQVVVDYILHHKINAKAIVWLTDGYLGCDTPNTPMPSLWGVVENETFVPTHGKLVRISV
jgi:predicted metal-dependent peptidase